MIQRTGRKGGNIKGDKQVEMRLMADVAAARQLKPPEARWRDSL